MVCNHNYDLTQATATVFNPKILNIALLNIITRKQPFNI